MSPISRWNVVDRIGRCFFFVSTYHYYYYYSTSEMITGEHWLVNQLERSGIFSIQRSNFETKDEVWQGIEMSIYNNLRWEHISNEQAKLLRKQLKCKLDRRFERFEQLLNGERKF